MHIEVGVGFPPFEQRTSNFMLGAQLRDLKRTLYDEPTHGSPLGDLKRPLGHGDLLNLGQTRVISQDGAHAPVAKVIFDVVNIH